MKNLILKCLILRKSKTLAKALKPFLQTKIVMSLLLLKENTEKYFNIKSIELDDKIEHNKSYSDSKNNRSSESKEIIYSDSKTEPLLKRSDKMIPDDELNKSKQYFTGRKIKKAIKIGHLNSLSAMIGEIGRDREIE